MSDLIVVTFDKEDDGLAALKTLRSLEKAGALHLEDSAVISKDPGGKVSVKNEMAGGTEAGIAVGAVLGGLLAVMFPIAGIVGGAVAGGLIGRSMAPGVDGGFVREVTEQVKPGSSAIFALVQSGSGDAIVSAFRTFPGQLRQTTLTPEYEEELRDALRTKK